MYESSKEILNVEFEVEKTIPRNYDYEEKLLKFRGNRTRYKAIIKSGTLTGIVGRMYTLVPNEEVLEHLKTIADASNLELETYEFGWRMYCFLTSKDSEAGVLVSNSVDGTIALRCDAIIKRSINSQHRMYYILAGTRIQNIYRKHTKNLTVKDLNEEVNTILKMSTIYKEALEKLDQFKLTDYYVPLKEKLERIMPAVYTKGVFYRNWLGEPPSIKNSYELVATRIWKRDTDIRTKIHLFKKLNDTIYSLAVIDSI